MRAAVHVETATSLTIIQLGYRGCCTEPGCRNVGQMILRLADAGGRPIDNSELCLAYRRSTITGNGVSTQRARVQVQYAILH